MQLSDKKLRRTGEQGFSLVSVLVALGLVLMSIALYSRAELNRREALRSISASSLYLDVEAAIRGEVDNFLSHISSASGCVNYPAIFASRSIVSSSGSLPITFTNNVAAVSGFASSGLESAGISQALEIMGSSQSAGGARERCLHPIKPNSPTNPAANAFYFCLNFARDPNASKDSFMGSRRAFAEVAIELVDIGAGSTASCQVFSSAALSKPSTPFPYDYFKSLNPFESTAFAQSPPTKRVGAQVHITLHWMVQAQRPYYKFRDIAYFVEKK